ncbi:MULTISPECIES: SMI1/KNR4 family protein [Priestia]|uniref:SMI1/KNR4 family protein n=1 Tax=Priestia megaterium TaxID=1404 RepID=A0ABD4X0W5_PRIMG|nr:SMI1/KNR4 family protein [Priestia megaterium]KRD91005.1 hypothetical protein ASE51_10555 [Bacillus sp. Root147]KRF56146.1 hypothetical protein ASG98_03680 [Bacillus sp. Soil531]MCF6796557.1 SMI1/KNR4 family protein [Bacillus sp. ET1]MBD8844650.1 SMI1/KNR4 family protein [Priestia megaterium]MBQ4869008.1 SMI1/KNR4 family protein [Priestia megaterium]
MKKINWIQPLDSPISEKVINDVESYFNIQFPLDYKKCILNFNGGYPQPKVFDTDVKSELVFSCLLSFTSDDANIVEVYEMKSQVLPSGIYPFARDPFGNLLCFDYRKNVSEPTIVFFDHEVEKEQAIYHICDTFTELLEKLYSLDD